jgi:hypothetical protein
VLVWRMLFQSLIVACMLLELFQTTPVNTKEKQHAHGIRLAGDHCDNRIRTNASVLVWRILSGSFKVKVKHEIRLNYSSPCNQLFLK